MNADKRRLIWLFFLSAFICVHLSLVNSATAEPVRGVSLAHVHRRGFGYGSDECREQLAQIAKLGANWVAITEFGFMKSCTDPHIRFGGGDRSMNEDDLRRTVADAHAAGLKVLLKPDIWCHDFHAMKKWHGDIKMN